MPAASENDPAFNVPIGALKAGSFPEAAGMVDALQLGYFEATPAELPYTLDEAALAVAARRIQQLRLGLSAYHVAQLPEGAEKIRRLFEFARRLNIETIIGSPEPAALADLDALATGAFKPVFDNDLDNLKYPAIRQYDAIFLNSTTCHAQRETPAVIV